MTWVNFSCLDTHLAYMFILSAPVALPMQRTKNVMILVVNTWLPCLYTLETKLKLKTKLWKETCQKLFYNRGLEFLNLASSTNVDTCTFVNYSNLSLPNAVPVLSFEILIFYSMKDANHMKFMIWHWRGRFFHSLDGTQSLSLSLSV